MDRRLPLAEREVLPGVTLVRSTDGGLSVHQDGQYIGFIHASFGDQWNAYLRVPGNGGQYLGRFRQDEAVRRIVVAQDRAG
jgi:hypothetical protein